MSLENKPMKKQIETLDHLNDLAWEISTAMKIVQIHKDDVIYLAKQFHLLVYEREAELTAPKDIEVSDGL